MTVVAAAVAALAVTLLVPARPRLPEDQRVPRRVPTPLFVLAAAAAAAPAVLHGRRLLLGAIGLLVLVAVQRLAGRRRAGRAAEVSSGRVMEFCESVAAELAAG
ncbi:MAG: hypothetical protein ABI873_08840, partial [Marmoricola sp.]